MASGAGFVQNFVLNKEAGYFDTASELKPLLHLWSLSIEEQFYLVFPVLIWGAWRMGLNPLSVVLLLGLLSFGINLGTIEKYATQVFFMPYTRFWELLAGSALAYAQLFKAAPLAHTLQHLVFHPLIFRSPPTIERRSAVLNNLLASCGLLLIVAAIFGLNKGKLYPGGWALFPVLGACLFILAGPGTWVNRKILASRVMVFVGLISYPLYLWHWPLLSFARVMEGEIISPNIRWAVVVWSFVLAWLTYRLIERPIRLGNQTWVKTAALCLLIALVGYVGYNAYQRDGLGFRVSQQIVKNNSAFVWSGQGNANEECKQAYPDFAPYYCSITKPIEPTIILVGDSHSNHLYPGLAEMLSASKDNILNLAQGGCLPFFNVATRREGAKEECASVTSRALAFAEDHDSVQTVVISSRGPLYLSGKGYNEIDENRRLTLTSHPEIIDHHVIFKTAMKSTLERLLAKNKQIIFVLDVPELGFDPKSCVETRPWRLAERPLRPTCAVSRQAFDERNRDYRALVASVLKDFPKVKVFDAAAELCDAQWCWAMKTGKMLYRNDDHLSVEGSLYLARGLAKLIQAQPQ
jgi:peptidoglycan/LPS O-acetylase OafA/YrhL